MLALTSALASHLVFLAPQVWDAPRLFLDQVVAGMATGAIYGLVALGIVLIYRATHVINFAQGEMALFVTFVGWSLIQSGMNYWLMFVLVLALAAAMGAFIERTVIRPVEAAPVLNVVIVTLGLFVMLNALDAFIWGRGELPKAFPATPFGTELDRVNLGFAVISRHRVTVLVITVVVMGALNMLFNYTKLGLAMRATAQNPVAARLMGINVGRMLMLGWALSAIVGAVGGLLVAPIVFLDLGTMLGVILFAFAAAVLGGLDSPLGAIVGGLLIGITQNLVSSFSFGPLFIGPALSLPVALLILVGILLVRPTGLFGHQAARRV